jgi:hypothetical protein
MVPFSAKEDYGSLGRAFGVLVKDEAFGLYREACED